jgi:hypothetical protein
VNTFWIIDTNLAILNSLDSLSKDDGATGINTFDFGQMYTNLHHEDIRNALHHVLSIVFSKIKYIYADMYSASWQEKRKSMICISKEKLLQLIDFVLDNAYFKFGNRIYRQIVGIPMGTDCGPYIANLTLFSYEFKYVSNLIKHGRIDEARMLNHTFRYIDDITNINDGGIFERKHQEIYPNSLTLKKMNATDQEANVLDINVKIKNGKFECKVYDKREEFSFICNRFPPVDTAISINAIYNIFNTELKRFFQICSDTNLLIDEINKLKNILLKRGYRKAQLSARFFRFVNKNKQYSIKFDLDELSAKTFLE